MQLDCEGWVLADQAGEGIPAWRDLIEGHETEVRASRDYTLRGRWEGHPLEAQKRAGTPSLCLCPQKPKQGCVPKVIPEGCVLAHPLSFLTVDNPAPYTARTPKSKNASVARRHIYHP